MQVTKYYLFFCIILSSPLWGGVREELLKIYEECGAAHRANVTSGEIYQGQRAGYATGGSVVVKNNIKNVKPLTVNPPHFIDMAGCGGIDIYTGGLSFINDKQLIETLKAIGSNSETYAFKLALQTISPQIDNVITQLQSWANDINSHNINSCEMAMQIVDSIALKRDAAQQQQCLTQSINEGMHEGFNSAKSDCASPNVYNNENKRNSYNLTWDAIKKNVNINQSNQMRAILMNLVGTLIVCNNKVEYLPPKMKDEEFLYTLMNGGMLKIRGCSDQDQCLVLQDIDVEIKHEESWSGKIETMLDEIQGEILIDGTLTDEQRNLVITSRIPIFKVLTSAVCYYKGVSHQDSSFLAQILSKELLTHYLKEVIESVRSGCIEMINSEFYSADIELFLDQLDSLETKVHRFESRSKDELLMEKLFMEKVDQMDKVVMESIRL